MQRKPIGLIGGLKISVEIFSKKGDDIMQKIWITIEDVGDNYRISNNATGEVTYCEKGKLNETITKLEKGELDNEL